MQEIITPQHEELIKFVYECKQKYSNAKMRRDGFEAMNFARGYEDKIFHTMYIICLYVFFLYKLNLLLLQPGIKLSREKRASAMIQNVQSFTVSSNEIVKN